jgi:hypothetical protein
MNLQDVRYRVIGHRDISTIANQMVNVKGICIHGKGRKAC